MELSSSRFLGKYTLHDDLGSGRFGDVSVAENDDDSLKYAVRTIDKQIYIDELRNILLKNEQILNLGHDNIIQTFHWSLPKQGMEGMIFILIYS